MDSPKRSFAFFLPHILAITVICGGYLFYKYKAGYWVTIKPVWSPAMAQLLPNALCNKFPDSVTACAWGATTSCGDLIGRLTEECLEEKSPEISFFILQPDMGKEYGSLVGTCVDKKLAQLPLPPERESIKCLHLVNEFHLATGEEQRNLAFFNRLNSSEALRAIEEVQKGKIEEIYQKALKSKRYDLEATEVRYEFRKKLLPTAATDDVVQFGKAEFNSLRSLCGSKGANGTLKKLGALAEKGDFLETVTPDSIKTDENMKALGEDIEKIPQEDREKQSRETDQALAAVIRSGAKNATKAPTKEDYEAKLLLLDTKMTAAERAAVEKDPMSCESLSVLMQRTLETDKETMSVLVKFMLSQN